MKSPRDCPCTSGERYAACCKPLHDGARASSAVALMRSRFAAFALGLGAYLVATLADDHPDRALDPELLARELGRVKDRQRFLALTIAWSSEREVLFVAKVFERGQDRSFAELSTFVEAPGGLRYASGVMLPRTALGDGRPLDRDAFLALAAAHG